MKHIAIILPGIDRIGGAERQAIELATGLARRGWRVTLVALSGAGGDAGAQLREAGVSLVSLEMSHGLADPRGWIRFNFWLRTARPDIIHAHLPHAVWLARWSRLGAPLPVLVDTLHTSSTGGLGRRLGYRASDWLTDRVTAVSCAVAQAHLSAGMVKESKIAVLPNGVDIERWRPDAEVRGSMRLELGLEGEFLWLAAGRLEPVKDYPTLLRAMAELPAHVRLAILGAGALEGELRLLATTLGIDDRVRLLGFELDPRRWMQAADGFVLASLWEGLPMALLEAAACSLPAVATDVAGTREALIDGKTGFLTPAADAASLRGVMLHVMDMPAEARRAVGEQARRMVIERFNMETVLDRWEQLYLTLMGQVRGRDSAALSSYQSNDHT